MASYEQITQKVEILGGSKPVAVHPVSNNTNEASHHGLITLNQRFVDLSPDFVLLTNNTFGVDMNQDASFTGTPSGVHDGVDSVLWTAQNIIGTKLTASSTDRFNSGSASVKIDNPSLNDVWEFDNGSNFDLTNFTALSMFANVDVNWTSDIIEIYGWDGSAEVGNRVSLGDYFNESTFDVWQGLAIPLSDMGLTNETISAWRMQLVNKNGPGPRFYMDDIQIEASGSTIPFRGGAPKKDKPYHVFSLLVTIVATLTGTVVNGTMPGLTYNQLLSLAELTNGFVLHQEKDGANLFTIPFRSIGEMLSQGFEIQSLISDGTTTQIVLELPFREPPIIFGSLEENHIGIDINDDLSSLVRFRATLRGASEV